MTTTETQPIDTTPEHLERHPTRANLVWDDQLGDDGDDYHGGWRYMTVHEALAAVLEELPAIGKNQRNTEQNFNFRGIDDVLNALNPLLGKYGVHYVPEVLERERNLRTTKTGSTMYEVNLHVRYTFYGPAGDQVTADGWGEGTDMGDKATNKAMTGAMKYVLFQTFAIATAEQSETDSDRHAPEETGPPPAATERQVLAVLDRLRKVHSDLGDYPPEWRAKRATAGKPGTYAIESLEQMATGDRSMPPESAITVMTEILDEVEHRAAETARASERANEPCQICGSTRAQRVDVRGVWRCTNPKDCEARAAKRDAPETEQAAEAGEPTPDAPATAGEAPAAIRCTGCGEPIGDGDTLVWDDDERPFHSEHLPARS